MYFKMQKINVMKQFKYRINAPNEIIPLEEAKMKRLFMISSYEFEKITNPSELMKKYVNRSTRYLQMDFEFDYEQVSAEPEQEQSETVIEHSFFNKFQYLNQN